MYITQRAAAGRAVLSRHKAALMAMTASAALLAALGGPDTIYPELPDKVKDPAAADAAAKARMMPAGPPQASRAPDRAGAIFC